MQLAKTKYLLHGPLQKNKKAPSPCLNNNPYYLSRFCGLTQFRWAVFAFSLSCGVSQLLTGEYPLFFHMADDARCCLGTQLGLLPEIYSWPFYVACILYSHSMASGCLNEAIQW